MKLDNVQQDTASTMKLIYAYRNAGAFDLAELKVDVLKSIWRCLKGVAPKKWPNKTELILQLRQVWSSAIDQQIVEENDREVILADNLNQSWEEVGREEDDENREDSDSEAES